MSFSRESWSRIKPLFRAILDHPFNRGLADGTLLRDRFVFYLIQDSLYLNLFSRALALASARSDRREEMLAFARYAAESVEIERQLHDSLFRQFGVSAGEVAAARPSPACSHYTSFLLATAYHEPHPVLVAALLPCFWIYWEVGMEISRTAGAANPYRSWVETYAGEEYAAVVRPVITAADRLAVNAPGEVLDRMEEAFDRSARLEWLFWDSAWRLERWPGESGPPPPGPDRP